MSSTSSCSLSCRSHEVWRDYWMTTTTTFGVVFHIFPIDFPQCCHAFDDSYHRLYVTNLYQNMGKLRVRGVAKVWDIEA